MLTNIQKFSTRIFTTQARKNLSKIWLIFMVGLVCRFLAFWFFNINVLIDFFHPVSLIYYFFMAGFTVFATEILALLDFSFISDFSILWVIIPSLSKIRSSLSNINLKYLNLNFIKEVVKNYCNEYYKLFMYINNVNIKDENTHFNVKTERKGSYLEASINTQSGNVSDSNQAEAGNSQKDSSVDTQKAKGTSKDSSMYTSNLNWGHKSPTIKDILEEKGGKFSELFIEDIVKNYPEKDKARVKEELSRIIKKP